MASLSGANFPMMHIRPTAQSSRRISRLEARLAEESTEAAMAKPTLLSSDSPTISARSYSTLSQSDREFPFAFGGRRGDNADGLVSWDSDNDSQLSHRQSVTEHEAAAARQKGNRTPPVQALRIAAVNVAEASHNVACTNSDRDSNTTPGHNSLADEFDLTSQHSHRTELLSSMSFSALPAFDQIEPLAHQLLAETSPVALRVDALDALLQFQAGDLLSSPHWPLVQEALQAAMNHTESDAACIHKSSPVSVLSAKACQAHISLFNAG